MLAPLIARRLPITFHTVRARELVVLDGSGQRKITLAAQDDSASLHLRAPNGGVALEMRSDALGNLLAIHSRADKASTGIRLDSAKEQTAITLQHQQAIAGSDSLTGYVSIASNAYTGATTTLHAADGGFVHLSGSSVTDVGAKFELHPGKRKDEPSAWLSIESFGGKPLLALSSTTGERACLDILNGPQLRLDGPLGTPARSASLMVAKADQGATLMLSGPGNSVFASTGQYARVSVINGVEESQSWSTPLPKAK